MFTVGLATHIAIVPVVKPANILTPKPDSYAPFA